MAIEISEDRQKHIMAVARKMHDIVASNPGKFEITAEDAFLLGYLHDVGYEFANKQTDHPTVGEHLLVRNRYRYALEVGYHGIPQTNYSSEALCLLNYADMTTGPAGQDMTIRERIDDIVARYGEDSIQTKDAKKLAEIIARFILEKDIG